MMRPMRPIVIAGNWKMNGTPAQAGALAASIAAATAEASVRRVICPPYVALQAVAAALAGSGTEVGAQNVHAEASGAYTGEISASMLVGLASWCIVGHSERRRDQHETDELVGRKLLRCHEHGLRPILCVGETLAEREAGRAAKTVQGQLMGALGGLLSAAAEGGVDLLVIAYEPVWAIGTGRNASGQDAALMAGVVRETLDRLGLRERAADVPVLYGGSVTSAAIAEFLAEPSLDGALVGGASLKVEEMAGIVARAALTARARAGAGTSS